MATFSYTKTFSAGETIVADDLMTNFNDVGNFVKGANLTDANLATPFANVVFSVHFGTVSDGTTESRRLAIPSGVAVTWVEAQVAFEAGAGTASVLITDDGANVLNSALTKDAPGAVASTTSFAIAESAAGSALVISVQETEGGGGGDDLSDVQVTVWAKIKIRS